jgi:hypothetical protein
MGSGLAKRMGVKVENRRNVSSYINFLLDHRVPSRQTQASPQRQETDVMRLERIGRW